MMSIRPLSRACGAEVTGIDLKRPIDSRSVEQLHRALGEHGILLFRDADLTPAEHVAFSRQFGPLETHVVGEFNLPEHPEVFVVSNVREEGRSGLVLPSVDREVSMARRHLRLWRSSKQPR